jgi:hypothetical protein
MNIAGLSTGLSQAKLSTDVGYAVQRQAMSAARQEGAAMVAMIQNAGQVGKSGGASDPLAAAATGKGKLVDVYG